MKTLSNTQYNN